MNNKYFTINTFYQFKIIKDKNDIITKLKDFCKFNKIKGTILIADEGINGTIAGLEKNINSFILYLENFSFEKLNLKRSKYKYMPFQKLKIRNKNEIVTLRTKFADPTKISGKKVMVGNNVSKAMNKTKRRFEPNLIKKRFFIPEEGKWITLKVSTSILKTINKKGISAVLKETKINRI